MTQELYINDKLIDLPQDSVIALTFAVNSLYDVKTVQGNVSNRINLPATANNLLAIGFPNDLNIDLTTTIRKRQTCRYIQNGVEVIPDGYVEINQITNQSISILITSGNTDFFELINGDISELDMSEYDHVWNTGNVIASRFNAEGYVYPVIDYGNLTLESTKINVKHMRLAVFLSTIVKKIVSETGYSLVNDVQDDPLLTNFYNNIIIPFSEDDWVHSQRYIDLYKEQDVDVRKRNAQRYESDSPVNIDWDFKFADSGALFNLGTGEFVADRVMNVNVNIEFPHIHMSRTWLAGKDGGKIVLMKHALAEVYPEVLMTIEMPFPKGSGSGHDYYDQTLTASNVSLEIGDKVYVTVEARDNSDVVINPEAKFEIKIATEKVLFGQEVQIEAALPDISKKDFMKFVAQFFCAVIQTDNKNKRVRIVPFSKIKDNLGIAEDWSSRYIPNEDQYETTIGDYAQRNEGKWKKDDAIIPENYGNSDIEIADENLPIVKTMFTFPFSASFDVNVLSSMRVMQILKIEDTETMLFKKKTQPRIGVLSKQDIDLTYTDGTTDTAVTAQIPLNYFNSGNPNAKPDMMMENMFLRSFRDLEIVLNDQRRLVTKLHLTEIDISELDFFVPVYIKRFACYFYLAKISDYVGEKPCKVELIKLY